jgi:hypothetical protein
MIANPVPDCARVRLAFSVAGRVRGVNLWFRRLVPPITSANLATLAARCRIATGFSYSNVLSSDCFLNHVEAVDFSTGPGTSVIDSIGLSPGFGSPTEAGSIALSLEHEVDAPIIGHPFVTYVPGIPLSQINDSIINSSYANGIALAWQNYSVNLPIFGWEYVAVSRVQSGIPRPFGLVQTVRGTSVRSVVVADRRMRLLGRPS